MSDLWKRLSSEAGPLRSALFAGVSLMTFVAGVYVSSPSWSKSSPVGHPGKPTAAARPLPDTASSLNAFALLKKSHLAETQVSFEGKELTLAWSDGRSQSAIAKRSHQGIKERTEFIVPGSMSGRIYLSDGRTTRIYNPRTRRVVVGPQESASVPNLALLQQNYQLLLEPTLHTVADRKCRVLRLQPRHPGKPHRVISLDAATALPLKYERFHEDGSPAGMTQFLTIQIGEKLPADRFQLQLPVGVRTVHSPSRMGAASLSPGAPSTLPAGYHLQECLQSPGGKGIHCLYSDGVDMLSVFSLPDPDEGPPKNGERVRVAAYEGRLRHRSHHRAVTWDKAGRRWTLIGDLSRALVMEIARAIATHKP